MKQAILRKTATQEPNGASTRIEHNNFADHSSAATAQRKRMEMLSNSPQTTAQRERMNTLQRVEEEEPLQGKLETTQRVEEEEPLQGKFETVQRVEEEEPLQGKLETTQRVEEEEPLQGKFETVQRVEEEEPLQGKFETVQRVEEEEPLQGKFEIAQRVEEEGPIQAARANNTGLPDNLKSGIESLSGISMDNVKVHYNSSQPAQLQALAYAQGNDIHVGPGQEQHLPHEAWHVAQQRQGRVKPTMQMKGGVPVNDDVGLESEADVMGAKALQQQALQRQTPQTAYSDPSKPVAQRLLMSHAVRGDSGEIYRPAPAEGFINLYQQHMSEDSDVLVDGNPGGAAGIMAVLKATAVTGSAIKEDLVSSIMTSGAWKDIGNATAKKSLADFILEKSETPADTYDTSDEVIAELAPEYLAEVEEWVEAQLTKLDAAATVGAIAAAGIPKEWLEDLAQLVYDATKSIYYGSTYVASAAYLPPFKALIGDINSGAVTELEYVRKYGEHTNPGAEFKVKKPVEKSGFYDGKAVVHTHYAETTKGPNYGHTKPYDQRFALGYGYTIVDLGKIKAINDTKKKWSEL